MLNSSNNNSNPSYNQGTAQIREALEIECLRHPQGRVLGEALLQCLNMNDNFQASITMLLGVLRREGRDGGWLEGGGTDDGDEHGDGQNENHNGGASSSSSSALVPFGGNDLNSGGSSSSSSSRPQGHGANQNGQNNQNTQFLYTNDTRILVEILVREGLDGDVRVLRGPLVGDQILETLKLIRAKTAFMNPDNGKSANSKSANGQSNGFGSNGFGPNGFGRFATSTPHQRVVASIDEFLEEQDTPRRPPQDAHPKTPIPAYIRRRCGSRK
jgi:hypothetical protein